MEPKFDIDQNLINELAKSIKSEENLAALKLIVERAMNVEMSNRDGVFMHHVSNMKVSTPVLIEKKGNCNAMFPQ